jgi:hypothetical protein
MREHKPKKRLQTASANMPTCLHNAERLWPTNNISCACCRNIGTMLTLILAAPSAFTQQTISEFCVASR